MTTNDLNSTDLLNLIIKADEGDSATMNMLHNYYSLEKYMTQKFDDGLIKVLTERANKNKPYSLLQLAIMHLTGLGLEQDFDKGIDLLKKSINAKCSHAYYFMAILVAANQIDYEMTYDELISKAIDMNNSSALVQKGIEYSETNFKKSVEFYKKAIELDNDYAIYKLGELYHDNKKYKLAIKFYRQAMDKNVDHAYFNLGVMYREGEGVKVDFEEAKKLLKKAMSLNNVRAITCIGELHHRSDNFEKAKKYYKLAIAKDDTLAKYNLGIIYETEEKHKKAIKCFIGNAKDGHYESQEKLLYKYNVTDLDMTDDEIDEILAFHNTFKNFGAYDGFLRH